VVALENEPDVFLLQLLALLAPDRVHLVAEELVFAGEGAVVHAQDVQQGGLARAGRAHDRDELALGDVQGDAAEHEHLASALVVGAVDVAETDQRFTHGWLSLLAQGYRASPHSARSAIEGSTRAARRAGT
jgi:hypothetical protein